MKSLTNEKPGKCLSYDEKPGKIFFYLVWIKTVLKYNIHPLVNGTYLFSSTYILHWNLVDPIMEKNDKKEISSEKK